MYIICIHSGIEYELPHFKKSVLNKALRINGVHPIFTIPLSLLNPRLEDWASGKLNEEESRLLFLAFLKSIDKVRWKEYAIPSHMTVQRNMERLAYIANWYNTMDERIMMPEFGINSGNNDLRHIDTWLDILQSRKEDYLQNYRAVHVLERIQHTEEILEKYIKSPFRDPNSYSYLIRDWVMDATNVPHYLREHWRKLFSLRKMDIINARRVDLEELLEHVEQNIGEAAGTIYGVSALAFIREMLRINIAGLAGSLGIITSDSLVNDDPEDVQSNNVKLAIAAAPIQEPKRMDYLKFADYLRAQAAWNLAQKVRANKDASEEQIINYEEILKTKIDEEEKDSMYFRILNDEDETEAVNQLHLNIPFNSLNNADSEE